MFVGIPIVVLYIGVVILIQYLLSFWSDYNNNRWTKDEMPFIMLNGPFITNSICIIYLGGYFGRTARWLTTRENHRLVQEHENALINKQYLFAFANVNAS